MFNFNRLKQFSGLRHNLSRELREKFVSLTNMVFGSQDHENARQFRLAFLSLVHPLLSDGEKINEKNLSVYRRLLYEYFDRQLTQSHLAEIADIVPIPPQEAVKVINSTAPDKAVRTAEFLIALAVAAGDRTPATLDFIRRTALELGMSQNAFTAFWKILNDEEKRKQRLRNSTMGVVAALVIIAIFLLTAKYLQSVIFGVLLACILLPMEKFFERRIRSGKGVCFLITKFFSALVFPLKKLSWLLSRKSDLRQFPIKQNEKIKERKIIRQSVLFTCFTSLVIAVMIIFGVSKLTGHYMRDVQKSIKQWEQERLMSNNGGGSSRSDYILSQVRDNVSNIPLLRTAFKYVEEAMNHPNFQDRLTRDVMLKTGSLLDITGGVLGVAVSFLCDALLTLFFALLFLLKFAEYSARNNGKKSGSEYIVRNIFNGIWLPGADDNLIRETCRIIDGILFRLRIWLKGYITLIAVDSTFYTTCFFFLGLPFFLPLGIIAGCGIALPYLGPILSCCLTVLVAVASGGVPGEILLAVVICYLFYNGIIEQFILYPAVIGDSLGLSTLETIIVVLLGAIFAGIPGMIFSLPAASVAKFIIPQIYRGFSLRKSPVQKQKDEV